MAARKDKSLRPQLSTLFNLGAIRERTDGQLLERFATERSELAELAFAALVERHGAMVMRVCRSQLASPHDAQDAFQAVFLILVKKARSLWVQDSLGPWLHQVALRTASCARADAARRRRLEEQAGAIAALTREQEQEDRGFDAELGQRLHEEIDRLPERYRIPIVLCDLQGHTCEEAARQLGRPVGTVKSWRSRGRERLRLRLIQSGLAPETTLEAALTSDVAGGAAPKPEAATVRAATRIRADRTTPGEVPASVWILVKGVMKTMLLNKLRTAAMIAIALALCSAGLGAVARVVADDSKGSPDEPPGKTSRPASPETVRSTPPKPKESGDEAWNLTLRDAIRIGLENSEVVRLRKRAGGGAPDEGYEIVPLNADQDAHRLKAEVMAHVRSIEQQYWSLVQQYAQLGASERAAELAEEIKTREESDLKAGRGAVASVAEASQRLEQFRLDLITRNSDVATTERQLRGILGLPIADGRRIVPISQLVAEKISPDWVSCYTNMLEKQPDIAHAISEFDEPNRKSVAADLNRMFDTLKPTRRAQGDLSPSPSELNSYMKFLLRKHPNLQQVIHQTTQSLARFFLELDAGYKQFETASRLRTAAYQRLEAQHAFYEEGRITIDRYLDAVSQHASAVAQEAQFKTAYNVSLIALAEAQGTLLELKNLTVVGPPEGAKAVGARRDGAATLARHAPLSAIPTPAPTTAQPPPIAPSPQPPDLGRASPAKAHDLQGDDAGKSFSFEFTVPISPQPVTIRGSFSVAPAPASETSKAP